MSYRPNQYVSVEQVATAKGVNVATVRRACGKPGGIPAEKVGKQWIILWRDAENWQPGKAGRPRKKAD